MKTLIHSIFGFQDGIGFLCENENSVPMLIKIKIDSREFNQIRFIDEGVNHIIFKKEYDDYTIETIYIVRFKGVK